MSIVAAFFAYDKLMLIDISCKKPWLAVRAITLDDGKTCPCCGVRVDASKKQPLHLDPWDPSEDIEFGI